ncbi:MAG: 3'-5' exonuclease domain-containing protein 2 [Dysgonamonadaceae bacterium]|nr:3'-5' exonuclease domain-containing protein 2 [Dysgonamonadaceae bacterium]
MGLTITKEELSQLESEKYRGKICIADNAVAVDNAVDYLSHQPVIGFDTETRPSFRKGSLHKVALIQMATEEFCFLFRINGGEFYEPLIELLSNSSVQKIGLSLRDDFHNLHRGIRFEPQGFIDLQKIISNYGIDEMSLTKIYALLFKKKISKNQRLTNWEAETLTEAQKHYAALDAWACLNIYKKLCRMQKSI